MNSFEFLEKLGFSSNEAKVYGTLIKHKVLNGYEIAKLSGVARSLVYEVINRLIAKGAVIRIDGEPNFYKPIEYQDLIRSIKEENEKNIACAERELQQLATENVDVDYVMNIVGEEKYVAKAKELIDSAQAEISLSIWQESFEVLRSNIENAISRGVKVYIFTFESISVAGATVYSYNINDVSTLFPYRRTTIIIDGGECLVGEEGDRNVYVHTRNHSVVSLATDEIVLNVFWNKLIEKENLLSKGCSGFFASHTQVGGALRQYRREDQEFSCLQFSKGENSKWQKMLNDYRRAKPKNLSAAKSSWAQEATSFMWFTCL